jgi:hypothetical protein
LQIPEERLRGVVLEALRRDFGGQWVGLTQAVAWVATERGMYPALQDTRIVQLDAADEPPLRACVEELIDEGVLALGIEGRSVAWPWLSLTERGREVVFGEHRSSGAR